MNTIRTCIILIFTLTSCSAKRGFILTSPKVLDAGSTEYFTVALFDVPSKGSVTLSLINEFYDAVITETSVITHNNYNTWVKMDIPDIREDSAMLRIRGTFADGYRFQKQEKVRIRHQSTITFIQTDKPIYKPGQTVKFRILPMNNQLVPLPGVTVGDVWVEDPSSVRVAQWQDMNMTEGIAQLELPLSEEPVYGTWTIHTSIKNVANTQTFQVEEYVLPKYEVVIEPPAYILVSDKEILVKICARYTYGKKVDGVVRAKMTYKPHLHELPGVLLPSAEYEGKISGCSDFVVESEELQIDNVDFTYRTIQIYAEVTENGTGIVQNGSATIEITHTPLQLKFVGGEKGYYFKPGLSYHGKLKVLNPDGSPSGSQSIKICATLKYKVRIPDLESCNTFISDKDGLIDFVIPAQNEDVSGITLVAKAAHLSEARAPWKTGSATVVVPHEQIFLTIWHSPSNSFLQIEPITSDVQCDRLEKVRIRYTTRQQSTIKFYHQVFSRGRIVQLGSHTRSFYSDDKKAKDKEDPSLLKPEHRISHFPQLEKFNSTQAPYIGEFMFSFDARSTMSPVARLLVFYVREDGEIVADSRSFRITHCLRNQVKYLFRHSQQYPGTETAILLSAMPSSLCGTHVVDKSVHMLRPEQKFSKEKVFKLMESFDVGRDDLRRRKSCHHQPFDYLRRKRSLLLHPSFGNHFAADAVTAFEEAGAVVMSDLVLETLPCPEKLTPALLLPPDCNNGECLMHHFSAEKLENALSFPSIGSIPLTKSSKEEREKEPEEEAASVDEIRSYFPETWLWELHKIGDSGEIAIKRELPHTITTWIGGAVCVHPKHGLGISDAVEITAFQPFFVSFNLPYSVIQGETVTISVSVFNYLTECLPINLALEPSESFRASNSSSKYFSLCVCGESSKTSKFHITPTVIGHINITVYVYTVQGSKICGNKITSRISARDAVTRQLLVEAEGFPKEETFNYFFCPERENGSYVTEVDLLLPENVITGSARAYMSITGDVMGPALNGLEKLVRLPVGCGEQNMVLFTPNIYVLDYLTSRGYSNEATEYKAKDFMQKGYQRELRYRHKDGSYSAFGESDDGGSIWLTAFVLKSFAQARRFIFIDEKSLWGSTNWITSHQLENGCFPTKGYLLNKNLQGGLKGQGSLAPLTAYILMSLLESGFNNEHVIKSSIYCLRSDANPSTYALALFAYASALAKDDFAQECLQELEDRAIKADNLMYWSSGSSNSLAVNVETAGYAILAILKVEGKSAVTKVLPVVRWITMQRNTNGGFVSTQDTVVALQALSRYSSLVSKEEVDVEVTVTSDNFVQNFKVEESNKLLMQTIKIPVLPTVADVEVTGKGCALVQFSLRYNVENTSGSDSFDISVKATRQGSYDCNTPTVGVCMRYKIPHEKSNMAVLEMKMASGYVPDEWSIHKLRENPAVRLKRHEIVGNAVNFYFDEISNEKNCFFFFVKSEIEIENSKEAVVKLYDYYQPEQEITTSYNIPSSCSLDPLPELPQLSPLMFDDQKTVAGDNVSTDNEWQERTEAGTTDVFTSVANISDFELTVTGTDPEQELTTVDMMQDMLQADSPIQGIQPSSDLFEDFVDVEHDLSFPDGIEENQPVYVLPPEDMKNLTLQECPLCATTFPQGFSDIFCASSFALRVSVRNPEKRSIKILHNISPHLVKPHVVKAFGKLQYDVSCNCTILSQRGTVLILGYPNSLWSHSDGFHHINLTSDVHVIAAGERLVQPVEVKTARRQCA